MISDTFIYDPEQASFYSLPIDVGRRILSGGNMAPPSAGTRRNYYPLEHVKASKPLVCFTTDVEELENAGCGQETWQRVHPSYWSNSDVLDVIFYVASKSSHGLDAVHNLRGEKFQGLTGSDLYRMTRQDFRHRDAVYGDLLFDCINELLEQSIFYPPAGISPTKLELNNNVEMFEDNVVDNVQLHQSLPRPVQELMDADGDDEPPLNLAADAAGRGTGCLCREDDRVADGPCVEICGHPYEFDNVTDFGSILQPSVVTGNDVLLGSDCCVYTTLTSAKPRYSTGIDYSLYSRPIDLTTGPLYRRPSQTASVDVASITAVSADPHRSYGPPLGRGCGAGAGAQCPKTTRKTPKRHRDSDDRQKPGKPNTHKTNGGSNGRHLWEFIRGLLQKGDDGDKLAGDIIRWEDRAEGIFRIIDSKKVAELWGNRKRNKTMTYEKLSRALRWSRTSGFLSAVPKDGTYPKKLCFKFADGVNWRD